MDRKIGRRQRWAWFAAGLSAVAASGFCSCGWIWVLIGGLLATLFYIYIDKKLADRGIAVLMCKAFGWGGKALAVLTLLWTVLVMGWTAALADTAFPMVNGFPGLGWIMLAMAAWGARKGAKACAGCSGVLCLFLIVLYGVVAVFAVPDVTWRWLKPDSRWEQGIWTAGLFLLPAGVWYVPCGAESKGPSWPVAFALPLFGAALSAVTAGVLSPELAAVRKVPLYDVAQSVSLFGVVERIEPLLSAAVTMGVFALLSVQVSAAQALADRIRQWSWSGSVACGMAGIAMILTKDMPMELVAIGSLVFWLVIPLIVLFAAKKRN